jgi:hypothetical protein
MVVICHLFFIALCCFLVIIRSEGISFVFISGFHVMAYHDTDFRSAQMEVMVDGFGLFRIVVLSENVCHCFDATCFDFFDDRIDVSKSEIDLPFHHCTCVVFYRGSKCPSFFQWW